MEKVSEPKIFSVVGTTMKRERQKANELDGKAWLQHSISVWSDIRKSPEELRLSHPAMFPSQLPRRIMEMLLTGDKKRVLDPFVGTGSTLVAAKQIGKEGYGFEISKEYVEIATLRLGAQQEMFVGETPKQKIWLEDANNLDKYIETNSIDICITSPPYWDILQQKRSVDNKQVRDYKETENNLGCINDYYVFLAALKKVFEKVFKVLKNGAYCVVVVMDIRKKNKFYPYHLDIIKFMQEIGFIFDDIIIWDRRQEYNNLKPIGYPSVFRINKVHEFILLFQKPIDRKQNK